MLHIFHMVQLSGWPLFMGSCLLCFMLSMIFWLKMSGFSMMLSTLFVIIWLMLIWFRDINRESILHGYHSMVVERGLQLGMLLFIFSEIMFFFSFFWCFFHSSLSPNQDIGLSWPPYNLEGINPFEIPLLNTLVLLSSGVTVTCAHFNHLQNKSCSFMLFTSVMLGLYFTYLQFIEYKTTSFNFSDSIFGCVFFMSSGFHGLHVIIGSILLLYSLFRLIFLHFSSVNPIGFEVSIWYWHFVDVVWLFLFSFIYWWGF